MSIDHGIEKISDEIYRLTGSGTSPAEISKRVSRKISRLVEKEIEKRSGGLKVSNEKYRILHAVSNIEIMGNTLDSVFEKTLFVLNSAKIYDIEKAGLALIDEISKTAIIRSVNPPGGSVFAEGFRIPLYGSSIGFSMRSKTPIIKESITRLRTYEETYLFNAGIKSYVVIPIFVKGKPIATLNLSSGKKAAFTSIDRQFFTLLSKQLSTLAKNINKHQSIRADFEKMRNENAYLQDEITKDHSYYEMVGRNNILLDAISRGRSLAQTNDAVLLCGETGTGKESLARMIHGLSPKRHRAFVKFDCRSTSPGLIHLELLGRDSQGNAGHEQAKIKAAGDSTLYIESVELIPTNVQEPLFNAIITSGVRAILSTSADSANLLGKDYIYGRLPGLLENNTIYLPPLRQRKEDIEQLSRYFIAKWNRKYSRFVEDISDGAIRHLMSYNWPGNINELANVIEEAVIICKRKSIGIEDIKLSLESIFSDSDELSYESIKERMKNIEREMLKKVLEKTKWRIYGKNGSARLLDVRPTTLQSRLKVLGLL